MFELSGTCPTIESLLALGFECRTTQAGLQGVRYRFAHLNLDAVRVMNQYARYVVMLSGVVITEHTVGLVESQIPDDLGSALEAAAWVSYALGSHSSELGALPDWYGKGLGHWSLIPFVRERREAQAAYRDAPKCGIDREYARPLRSNLLRELSELSEETEMTFSFDGRVLSIAFLGSVHEVVASGDSWPSAYRATVSADSVLPTRFMSSTVEVCVFEGHVRFDRLPLGPYEAVP